MKDLSKYSNTELEYILNSQKSNYTVSEIIEIKSELFRRKECNESFAVNNYGYYNPKSSSSTNSLAPHQKREKTIRQENFEKTITDENSSYQNVLPQTNISRRKAAEQNESSGCLPAFLGFILCIVSFFQPTIIFFIALIILACASSIGTKKMAKWCIGFSIFIFVLRLAGCGLITSIFR